ncbi:MAG TPA: bifunctional 2-polyprenyl-6-hydroxyphenol methylase/3-demethylubiquinol 3-O-methyltransferase UbiG [Candidatus Azoamicus sp. OHIO2]
MSYNIFDKYMDWLDLYGSCKALHSINNIRFNYIIDSVCIKNKKILDIGCGGGILSEKLSLHGANVIGIDKSAVLIDIAKKKRIVSNTIYVNTDLLNFISNIKYDIIVCMEILEHLKDINIFFDFLIRIKSNNTQLFVSSLDKTLRSYFQFIFFGEYVVKTLKKNTHDYSCFLNIDKLCHELQKYQFIVEDIKFIKYHYLTNFSTLSHVTSPNYIIKVKVC